MTDNDALAREQIADIIDERVSSPAFYGDQNMEAAHRRDQLCAADEILAALRSTPQAYPVSIGRLHLGEKRSNGERLCNWGHEVLVGHPLYWPQAISQYDDSDPCCIEHAIEQYASEAGYGADAPNLSATAAIAALDRHPAGDDALREENARLREALKDSAESLSWAARQMKGNCRGSDIDAVNLAAGRAANSAALTGRQG